MPEAKLSDWLGAHLKAGAKVGFDPWLHTPAQIEELEKILAPKGIKLKPLAQQSRRPRLGQRAPGRRRQGAVIAASPAATPATPAEQKIADLQATLRKAGEDCGHAHAARFHRLAAQHPRLGRGAQSRARWRSRSCPRAASPSSSSIRPRSAPEAQAHLRSSARAKTRPHGRAAQRARSPPRSGSAGRRCRHQEGRQARAPRSGRRRGAGSSASSGGKAASRAAPIPACCRRPARTPPRSRARASPTSATARRWRASSPGSTARRRAGRLDEIGCSMRAGDDPQRDAGAEGDQLRHHLRRRPQRRHRALPRHRRRPTAS